MAMQANCRGGLLHVMTASSGNGDGKDAANGFVDKYRVTIAVHPPEGGEARVTFTMEVSATAAVLRRQ
jgi:hypothetical protein